MTTANLARRTTLLAVLLVLVASLGACSKGNKTGNDSLLNFDQEQASKFGASTTTTAPPAALSSTTAAPQTTVAAKATTTTAPARQVTTTLPPEKQEVTLDVSINEQSPYFDPSVVQVLVGSKVRFTNKGSQTHSVLSDTAAFDSGPIKPGGVWIYEATKPGRYNYSDAGRPFAVGSLEVVE